MDILLGRKPRGGKSMEDSFIKLSKRGISSKVFTVSTSLEMGGLFLGRGTLGT